MLYFAQSNELHHSGTEDTKPNYSFLKNYTFMIKYALAKNQMASDKPNFVANVSCMDNISFDDLLNKMVEEGTGLTRPQAMAYFERLTQTVISLLENGCTVNTPLFKVRLTIKGVFETADDYFDPEKQTPSSHRAELQKSKH
ncbi:MAG: DNA-binding domain-containing protein [Paludibacter sp.]|nr:DNA-binding domain-containing protein [Paludibacter sp.]